MDIDHIFKDLIGQIIEVFDGLLRVTLIPAVQEQVPKPAIGVGNTLLTMGEA